MAYKLTFHVSISYLYMYYQLYGNQPITRPDLHHVVRQYNLYFLQQKLYWTVLEKTVPGEFPAHKGQWRGALMFSLICVWINGWVKNREVGDLRRHRAHYDVIVMKTGLHDPTPIARWCGHLKNRIVYVHCFTCGNTDLWKKARNLYYSIISYA